MSRIDEALRRTRSRLGDAPAGDPRDAGAFVSPWTISREVGTAERRPARPSPTSVDRRGKEFGADQPSAVRPAARTEFLSPWRERLIVSPDADPMVLHQFRRLVATLLQAQGSGQLKTLMITSPAPGDGKTLTALNLALALSESYGRRVLLVEGDLRRPAICAAAGLPATTNGLSDVINAADDRRVTLVRLTELLTLMPAGRPDADPLTGLTSGRLERVLKEASERFDWVIIDTPPLGAAPDAGLMAPLADAVLLVIRAGQTPHAAVQHAIETLGAERILGIVLNAADPGVASGYDDYYGHYSKA